MTSDGTREQTDGSQEALRSDTSGAPDLHDSQDSSDDCPEESLRDRRTAALLHVKKALDLAEELKLVSLNIAVASAQTQSENWDVRKLKTELAELTNQAVKASKETSSLIEAINGSTGQDESHTMSRSAARDANEFRRAVELRKSLEELLGRCRMAVNSLDKIDGSNLT